MFLVLVKRQTSRMGVGSLLFNAATRLVQSQHCAGVPKCRLPTRIANKHRSQDLDDFGIDLLLLLGSVKDDLLNGASADQHQHQHLLLLTNAVRPVLCLHTPSTLAGLQPAGVLMTCSLMPILGLLPGQGTPCKYTVPRAPQ